MLHCFFRKAKDNLGNYKLISIALVPVELKGMGPLGAHFRAYEGEGDHNQHGSTKCKSCLTTIYDEGREVATIFLKFSKVLT